MNEKKQRDGIKEINKVCKSVLKLQESDFEEVEKMIEQQERYTHPLKCKTAGEFNELGNHNRRVMNALKQLKETIEQGE